VNAEQLVPLAWLAGRAVEIDEDDLRGPVRRAVLLLAAGGDPLLGLQLDGRAVTALADELDTPERREALLDGLRALDMPEAAPLSDDPELAWRAFACALLADELAGEE
jgi:hypothetical protein